MSGCGSLSVDNNSVKSYKKPVVVSNDETLVYIIRESSFVGSARGLWVAHNKDVVADLSSGDYTYFKVKKGINTINLVQGKIGSHYYAIDEVSPEPIFLKFAPMSPALVKLSKDLGITYVTKYNEVKTFDEKKENDGYINGLLNLAMYPNFNMMTETNQSVIPDENHAVITFIRSSNFAEALKYTIWSDNGPLGNLEGKSYFQVKVPRGKHYFYVQGEGIYTLEANVEANKNYVIGLDVGMGWMTAYVKLNPIDLSIEKSNNEYNEWKKSCKQMKLIDPLDSNIKTRIEMALPEILKIKNNILSGEKDTAELKVEYGI